MTSRKDRIFANEALLYRAKGFSPRPITPGTKACQIPHWQALEASFNQGTYENWNINYGAFGIGLVMGTLLPDGMKLGAIDVDDDRYVRVVAEMLHHPTIGKFGQKGATFFVRVAGRAGGQFTKNPEFRVNGDGPDKGRKVVECLFDGKLCVIPPTIHPGTGEAYRWLGKPLLDANHNELPIVEFV